MAYIFHGADAQDDAVMSALYGREKEHSNYGLNASNYQAILASAPYVSLPAVWPSNLTPYQSVFGEQLANMVNAGTLALADYQTVTQLQYRDRVQTLLQTTLTEQAKSAAIYAALTVQVADPVRYAAAVARYRAKLAAGTAT